MASTVSELLAQVQMSKSFYLYTVMLLVCQGVIFILEIEMFVSFRLKSISSIHRLIKPDVFIQSWGRQWPYKKVTKGCLAL